jgi:hypothetical protein
VSELIDQPPHNPAKGSLVRVLTCALAVLCITQIALNHRIAVAARLPGSEVYEAGKRLGWGCRADPQSDFGRGFYFFSTPVPPNPAFLVSPCHGHSDRWHGLLVARPIDRITGWEPADVAAEESGSLSQAAGWELFGDPEMVAQLARELGD